MFIGSDFSNLLSVGTSVTFRKIGDLSDVVVPIGLFLVDRVVRNSQVVIPDEELIVGVEAELGH